MSDFLDRVVARVVGADPALTPRLPSLFEPSSRAPLLPLAETVVAQDGAAPAVRPNDDAAMPGRALPRDAVPPSLAASAAVHTGVAPPRIDPAAGRPSAARAVETSALLPVRRASVPPMSVSMEVPASPRAPSEAEPVAPKQLHAAPAVVATKMPQPKPAEISPAIMPKPASRSRENAPVEPAAVRTIAAARSVAVSVPATTAEPVVHVSIGRLEVRAAPAPAPSSRRREVPPPSALETYLRQRGDKRSP